MDYFCLYGRRVSSKTFSKAKRFLYQQPEVAHQLLQKITDTTIAYLQGKVESGANLIQLFDSWAGILPPPLFRTFAQQIASAIQAVPVTVFAKGAWFALEDLDSIDCNVIGLDWCTSPAYARQYVNKVLQGNLDPCQLYGDKDSVCLLYTSPSPRDLSTSRMPSSA